MMFAFTWSPASLMIQYCTGCADTVTLFASAPGEVAAHAPALSLHGAHTDRTALLVSMVFCGMLTCTHIQQQQGATEQMKYHVAVTWSPESAQ
jgi:hypothetical protein